MVGVLRQGGTWWKLAVRNFKLWVGAEVEKPRGRERKRRQETGTLVTEYPDGRHGQGASLSL